MSCLQKVRQELCILLVTFFVLFFFLPVLMLIFLPMYGWRFLIFKLSKIFRSTEGKMLCTYASLFASDKIFKRPLCNLLLVLLVDGRLDINKLRENVQTRLLDKRVQPSSSSNNNNQQEKDGQEQQQSTTSTTTQGELAYPELRQYIRKWPFCLGYYFWTFDKKFSLDHYVKMYDGKFKDCTITDFNMGELVNELNNKKFQKTKSPWEMVLLDNVCIKTAHTVEGRVRARDKGFSHLNILSEKSKKGQRDYPRNLNPLAHKHDASQSKAGEETETKKVTEKVFKILNLKSNSDSLFQAEPKTDSPVTVTSSDKVMGDGEIIKGILKENSGQSMIILRMHHCIGDGISMRNLALDFIGCSELKVQSKNYERNQKIEERSRLQIIWSKIETFFKMILFPILGVYQTVSCMFKCYDENAWHIPEDKLTREMSCAASELIPVDFIKDIKNSHNTTFHAVIVCAIAGGLRTFMLRNNFPVPQNMHVLSPLPFRVSEKLRNHVTAAFLRLPVGLTNPEDRMGAIKKYLKQLNKSLVPLVNYLAFPILGGLFPGLTRMLYRQSVPTGLISAFPGPDEPLSMNGKPIIDMVFGGGLHRGNISFGFTLLSYNGYLRILVGVDKAIFPNQEMGEELVEDVIQEFHHLKACSSNRDKDASV